MKRRRDETLKSHQTQTTERIDHRDEQLYRELRVERRQNSLLKYAFSFGDRPVIHTRRSRNTSLQPPQLQKAEGRSRRSFPRLVCKDITTKLSLNSHLVTSKTRGIYDIAIVVVIC
jgi:hypothetical protein